MMAKRLEESLYKNAKSFKEYKDPTTLRHRLQQVAARLGNKALQNRAKVMTCEEMAACLYVWRMEYHR